MEKRYFSKGSLRNHQVRGGKRQTNQAKKVKHAKLKTLIINLKHSVGKFF